jgi:hypothetical protein
MYPPSPYPEPPRNTPVAWQTLIGAQLYTYVALGIPGAGWFLTGQVTNPLSWDALCCHLPPADGRFLVLGVVGQLTPAS